jgi:uncharacterized protein (DUF302 family)
MLQSRIRSLWLVVASVALLGAAKPAPAPNPYSGDGLVKIKSTHSVALTVTRAKVKIEDLSIAFFDDIDQSALAAIAGMQLSPSHLLIFGNPPLGIQFLTSKPLSGIDWPVRMLVFQDENGEVWIAYSDFSWIAARHGIRDRDAAVKTATEVAVSIAGFAAN